MRARPEYRTRAAWDALAGAERLLKARPHQMALEARRVGARAAASALVLSALAEDQELAERITGAEVITAVRLTVDAVLNLLSRPEHQ